MRHNNFSDAATFAALSGDATMAQNLWIKAGQPQKAAGMLLAMGENKAAGSVFEQAATTMSSIDPTFAAILLSRAADCYELAKLPILVQSVRERAGHMGRFAHVTATAFNIPTFEAGLPDTLAIRLVNQGNELADSIRFQIGGNLLHRVHGTLQYIAPRSDVIIEFADIIPTRTGAQDVRLLLKYAGAGQNDLYNESLIPILVSEPPSGVNIMRDAGSVVVKVPLGTPLPQVRVRGDVGHVRYEVTST
jgi:hypothetical protein